MSTLLKALRQADQQLRQVRYNGGESNMTRLRTDAASGQLTGTGT